MDLRRWDGSEKEMYPPGFLRRNFWDKLDHDLMASIREKAISIVAGYLN